MKRKATRTSPPASAGSSAVAPAEAGSAAERASEQPFMKKPVQQHRQIAIATNLGPDALVLNRFVVRERLGAPFEIEAELSANDANIPYAKVVGFGAAIRLELGDKGTRYWQGLVSRFVQTGNQGGYARYRATIVPWLWFLTRTSDCRVFQRKKVLEIAEEVFDAQRFGSEFYEPRLKERYPARRYCVQYRETDFNFVNRLFESEGIYYWFEHTQDRHRLVLADAVGASRPAPGYEALDYHELDAGPAQGREVITDWVAQQEVQPVGYLLKDFDFKKPSDPLAASSQVSREHGMARFGVYDYPGEYFDHKEAERCARLRLEELQARYEVFQASTTARGLAAGQVFELKKHGRKDQNRKYLITDLTLTADAGEFASGGTGEEFFTCHFSSIPAETPYRPPRTTPKPVIQGIQTATVVGAKGKEVDPDEHGRVKVQFHWDRYGKRDENSSCWVRVAQPWAGKGYGGMDIPRLGQEVVVEFIEGDPDRPLINGRLYNAESMPHPSNAGHEDSDTRRSRDKAKAKHQQAAEIKQQRATRKSPPLAPTPPPPAAAGARPGPAAPAPVQISKSKSILDGVEKFMSALPPNPFNTPPASLVQTAMMSSFKSNSLGGGGGCNELTMNDAGGAEGLFLKAQKDNINTIGNDRETTISNDDMLMISNDRTKTIGNDETIEVGNDRLKTIGNDETVEVGNDRHKTIGNDEDSEIGNDSIQQIGNDLQITIGNDLTTKVGNDETTDITADQTITVGGDQSLSITGAQDGTIGKGRTTSVGEDDSLSVTKKLDISAGDEIVIATGAAKIEMKKDGTITISGKDITVTATEKLVLKCKNGEINATEKLAEVAGDLVAIEGKTFSLEAKGGQGAVKAKANLALNGAFVKINC